MSNPYKINAIIINSDLETRMRLKQASASVPMFGPVRQVGSLWEGSMQLDSEVNPCDVLFIADRFPVEDITEFIIKTKEKKQGQDAAFVLVLQSKEDSNSKMAELMVKGFDGFLVEPYSVDCLVEITQLAARVKKERGVARARLAITMVLRQMMEQLDLVAYLKGCGYEVSKSLVKLKELGARLQPLAEDGKEDYVALLASTFADAPLPKKPFQTKKYGGVSQRVKRRMEEKVIKELGVESPLEGLAATTPKEK
jgi:hypothetical protein